MFGPTLTGHSTGRLHRSSSSTPKSLMTSSDQRRALRLLADCPQGCTVANMLAHGFKNEMLDRLVRDGLATIQPGTVRTGTRQITVVWVTITKAGRRVLAVQ
jgi:hypothetical protein